MRATITYKQIQSRKLSPVRWNVNSSKVKLDPRFEMIRLYLTLKIRYINSRFNTSYFLKCVLGSAGTESIFLIASGMMLCFGFRRKAVMTIHYCFSCC